MKSGGKGWPGLPYEYLPADTQEGLAGNGAPSYRASLHNSWKMTHYQELKCKSRAGVLRVEHELDKDGVCIYCDTSTGSCV